MRRRAGPRDGWRVAGPGPSDVVHLRQPDGPEGMRLVEVLLTRTVCLPSS